MLILASKSPRRKELLSLITTDFEIIPAVGEENADPALSPDMFVRKLAEQKAQEIAASHPSDTVIGSDTVVAINGEIGVCTGILNRFGAKLKVINIAVVANNVTAVVYDLLQAVAT